MSDSWGLHPEEVGDLEVPAIVKGANCKRLSAAWDFHGQRNGEASLNGLGKDEDGKWRRFIFENRIVAVINRFDPNDRLIFSRAARAAGIITRPLAERSFGSRFFSRWRDLAFDGDF